jgi:hypothetical protein
MVKRGENQRGLQALDTALKRLGSSQVHKSDIALANLYMGAAYADMGQAGMATDRFREALRLDKGVRLDPKEFPPHVIQVFEQARGGGSRDKTLALIGGGLAVAGTSVAVAAAAGGGDAPPVAAATPSPLPNPVSSAVGPTPAPPCTGGGAPRVSMIFPRDFETLSGTVVLRASALDDGGVAEVRFFVDDRLIGLASAGLQELPWDTRAVPNGLHQIQARAFDGCQNQGFSQPVPVSIRN